MTYRSPKSLEDCHNAANAYADTLRQQGMDEAAAVAGATHFMDGWWAARDTTVANIIRDLDTVRTEPKQPIDPALLDRAATVAEQVHESWGGWEDVAKAVITESTTPGLAGCDNTYECKAEVHRVFCASPARDSRPQITPIRHAVQCAVTDWKLYNSGPEDPCPPCTCGLEG